MISFEPASFQHAEPTRPVYKDFTFCLITGSRTSCFRAPPALTPLPAVSLSVGNDLSAFALSECR